MSCPRAARLATVCAASLQMLLSFLGVKGLLVIPQGPSAPRKLQTYPGTKAPGKVRHGRGGTQAPNHRDNQGDLPWVPGPVSCSESGVWLAIGGAQRPWVMGQEANRVSLGLGDPLGAE